MKVAGIVGAIVVATLASVGAGVLFALYARDDGVWMYVVPMAFILVVLPPLMTGGTLLWWDMQRSDETRRIARRLLWIVVACQVIAAVVFVTYTALTGAAWWLPVAAIGVGALLTAVAFTAAPALQRRDAGPAPAPPLPSESTRENLRRDVRRIVLSMVITAVAAALFMVGLLLLFGEEVAPLELLLFLLAFPLMAGAIASTIVSYQLLTAQRQITGGDVVLLQGLGKIVVGTLRPSSPEEESAAGRYATTAWISATHTLVSTAMLYAALILLQVNSLQSGAGGLQVFSLVLVVVIVVGSFVLIPQQIRRIRRMRASARAHPVPVP